jgi:TRAP transporter TAXI family solute receptor
MTGAATTRLAALAAVLLALASPGEVRHRLSDVSSQKTSPRLVPDTTFGDALAQQYERLLPNVRIELVHAIGSAATVNAIQRGDADLGFALADVAYFGYLRAHQQDRTAAIELRGIAALQLAPMYLLARAGLHVKTVRDVAGYRVGVGTALAGQSMLAGLLFRAYGLGHEWVQPDRRIDLLAGVDATFATAYYPAATVTRPNSAGAHLIPIDGPIAAQLRREYPFVRSVTIPAGTYPGQTQDVVTLGVQRVLIGSTRLDERWAHDLTRAFIESLPLLSSSIHTSVRLTNLEQASATPIPLHFGAAQYYRERELMR